MPLGLVLLVGRFAHSRCGTTKLAVFSSCGKMAPEARIEHTFEEEGSVMTAMLIADAGAPVDELPRSMPVGVRKAVDLLTSPQGVSDACWGVRSAVLVDHGVDDDQAQRWVEEELQVLEAVEVVKAWADAVGLGALRRLREAVGEQVQAVDDLRGRFAPGMPAHVLRAESDTAAVDEVVL